MRFKSIPVLLILLLTSNCTTQQKSISDTPSAILHFHTYINPLAGFSIDYPSTWFLVTTTPGNAMITSWDMFNATPDSIKGHELSNEFSKIDINLIEQNLSLEDVINKIKKDSVTGKSVPFKEENLVNLGNNLQGMLIEVDGFGGPSRHLIVVMNGYRIQISGYGNLQNFDAIALSFRTIK